MLALTLHPRVTEALAAAPYHVRAPLLAALTTVGHAPVWGDSAETATFLEAASTADIACLSLSLYPVMVEDVATICTRLFHIPEVVTWSDALWSLEDHSKPTTYYVPHPWMQQLCRAVAEGLIAAARDNYDIVSSPV